MPYGLEIRSFRFQAVWSIKKSLILYLVLVNLFSTILHGYSFITFVARLEYQSRQAISGASSFKNLLARLPPRVHSVYYRDEIGNISSSNLRSDSHKVYDISPLTSTFKNQYAS